MHANATQLRPGDVLAGRYRIEAHIGAGGFGAVFRATQLNLGRPVALKVLLPDLVRQPAELERFRREAQMAQRLEHPNTVRLFDFGVAEDTGVPYMAWELLKGQPLDALLKASGQVPPARVGRIAMQVLKSLMEAHSLGIVHRDIKPSNIFLCDFSGEPDFVKVLDFGIAKATQSQTQQGLTRAGVALGTPSYMSPEQVAASGVTPVSDLYALGLVMAEMLTGRVVFTGQTGVDIALAQVSPSPVPLAPEVLNSPLGPVIQRATQKTAAHRYASATEMLQHLEAVMRSAPQPGAAGLPTLAIGQGQQAGPGGGYLGSSGMGYPSNPQQMQGYGPPPMQSGGPLPYGGGPLPYGSAPGMTPHGSSLPPSFYGQQGGHPGSGGMYAPQQQGQAGPKAGLIALIVGAGFVVSIMTIGIAVALSPDDGGGGAETTGGTLGGGRLGSLTSDDLRARIKQSGWEVTGETNSNQVGFSMTSFTMTKLPQVASVNLYRYDDPNTATILEGSLASNGRGVVTRDGATILFVMVIPEDPKASRELMNRLTR
jgi:serine/threonine-protein kinase